MFDNFYGFSARPFQLTPDPAFYFESLTHRKALSYLGYGLAQGEGFIVITGEVGAGKSTLVAHLMSTIDRQRLTAAQIVTSRLNSEELVHVVAQAFALPVHGHDKAMALGAIEGFLHREAREGRRVLLVVDEAQNLSLGAVEELRMLSNFQLGNRPLLQILLLGQPEFRDLVQTHPQLEQLRQRVIAAHHLEAMEAAEVEAYIVHRLRLVGWNGNPEFEQRVFGEIYTATAGVPRRVNQIVNRLLILGAVEHKTRIDGVMLAQVMAELNKDGGLQIAPAPLRPEHAVAPAVLAAQEFAPVAAPVAAAPVPAAGLAHIEAALAQRDGQIAELQQAVIELANQSDTANLPGAAAHDAAIEAIHERLATLEARVIEQDRTIRHTLTMLIEWIERDEAARAAA